MNLILLLLYISAETLVEVPYCPYCESEMVLEVPAEPVRKTPEFLASGKLTANDSSSANQYVCLSAF